MQSCGSLALAAVADSMAAKFERHQFVFIGSTHGDAKIDDFLICLVSRSSFQRRVTDIIVEYASPYHQRLLDRHLLTLEAVPDDSLARVWFDTDAPRLWASLSQLPQFLAAIRTSNGKLPPARRIRVLGGNEPVNWDAVEKPEDLAPYPFKNNYTTHLIVDHLAPIAGNRTLVVYGDGHIHHNGGTMMAALEAKLDRAQLFVIGTIHELKPDESKRVALFGNPAQPFFRGAPEFPTSTKQLPGDLFYVRGEPLSSYLDAIIYLGPARNRDLSNTVPLTANQRRELARRDRILNDRRQVMQIRYGGRDTWFKAHPNDLPDRP